MPDFLYGLFHLSWWGYLLVTFILLQTTIQTVTLYYHRSATHRAVDFHPVLAHFFRFWGWFTTGMIVKQWVAVHRKHHAFEDTPDDPHSPQIYGLPRILFTGVERYYVEGNKPATLHKFGKGTPRDWIERKLYTKHKILGVSVLLVLQLACFGVIGFGIWVLQVLWIPFWGAGVINGVGHTPLFRWLFCYRNSDTNDASANIVPWGIWIGGEELHNNHHAYPMSAKFSLKSYEFDIGWMIIRVYEFFRLAKVNHRAIPHKESSRVHVDDRTIAFLRGDRGFVRGAYRKLLLYVARRESNDPMLSVVHTQLRGIIELLSEPRWNVDPLPEAYRLIVRIKGSGSRLPRIGEFIVLFSEIKGSPPELDLPAPDRDTLLTRLNQWVTDVRSLRIPRGEAFVRRLVQSVSFRSTTR